MQIPPFDATWPEAVKLSHHHDVIEIGADPLAWRLSGERLAYRERWQRVLDLVQKAAAPPARLLDVAAAQGNFSLALAEQGYEVTWNDIRPELIDYVERKRTAGCISYAPGNILDMEPDTLGRFDIVLAGEVIEHVAFPDHFLASLARFLTPEGRLIVTTPNGAYFRNSLPRFSDCPDPSVYEAGQFQPDADGHIFLLHVDEMRLLADRAGLQIESLSLFTTFLTNGHLKTAYLLPILPYGLVRAIEVAVARLPLAWCEKIATALAVVLKRRDPT